MRAVDYPRVSTDEQAREGYSIASQHESNTKFIGSQQNWNHVGSYIDDGYSAKDLNRPAMQRLIKDAQAQKFDVVVFYKLDRLVRSVSDLDKLLKIFDANNIGIRSVTEPFDTTTAMGRFLITLVAAIAQWERETISERVVVNMMKKATLGERNGGKAPYGYKLKDGKLIIHEEEAKVVREMFRLYINGKGIRSITLYLQQFGVEKGIRTISRMIENPVYCGKLRWANNSKMDAIISDEIIHPQIVDEETFERAQAIRTNRTTEGKKATSPFHFSGVLKCARCGSPLSGYNRKAKGSKHYLCINRKNNANCDLPQFTEHALTSKFLEELSPDDPYRFFSLAKDFVLEQKEMENADQLIDDIERELAAIRNRKKNWLMALGNGIMSQEEYLSMTSEDTKKEELLNEQLKKIDKVDTSLDRETVLSLLENISKSWDSVGDYEKKGFINDLFESIIVDVPKDYIRAAGRTPSVIIKEVKLH
jgi:site-specific DNA recombinase